MTSNHQSNPYATPGSSHAASLSRHERRILEFYWNHRYRAISFAGIFTRMLPMWIILLALFIPLGAFFTWADRPTGSLSAAFIAGALVAAFSRDVGYAIRICQTWPLLRRILDWQAVAECLEKPQD